MRRRCAAAAVAALLSLGVVSLTSEQISTTGRGVYLNPQADSHSIQH